MSKTDKTKPFWVKEAQGELPTVAFHRCEADRSKCDLPAAPPLESQSSRPQTKCFWHFGGAWTGNICGCRMCTGYDWRKQERRRTRHTKRKTIEEELSGDHD